MSSPFSVQYSLNALWTSGGRLMVSRFGLASVDGFGLGIVDSLFGLLIFPLLVVESVPDLVSAFCRAVELPFIVAWLKCLTTLFTLPFRWRGSSRLIIPFVAAFCRAVSLIRPFGTERLVTDRTRLFGHLHITCPSANSVSGHAYLFRNDCSCNPLGVESSCLGLFFLFHGCSPSRYELAYMLLCALIILQSFSGGGSSLRASFGVIKGKSR